MRAVLNNTVKDHVVNPEETAKKLARYIDMDESNIYDRLTKKGAFQVEFGKAGRN